MSQSVSQPISPGLYRQENDDSSPSESARRIRASSLLSRKRGPSGLTSLLAEHFEIDEAKMTQKCPTCNKTWGYNITRQRSHLENYHPKRAGFITAWD